MSIRTSREQQQAFADHVVGQMAGFAPVQAKRMFGGFGLYHQGLMFGIIIEEVLYLKADDTSRPRFEALGLQPFTYEARGKRTSLSYFAAPPEVYEEPAHMVPWAREGFQAAVRQAAAKAAKTRKTDKKASQATGVVPKKVAAKSAPAKSAAEVSALRNLGEKSQAMMAKAGIKTEAQLRKLGSVRAYVKTKAVWPQVSLNLLWAMEGALTGRDWKVVAEEDRATLLMALEDVLRHEST